MFALKGERLLVAAPRIWCLSNELLRRSSSLAFRRFSDAPSSPTVEAPHRAWHEWSTHGLTAMTTAGNILGLCAAASHDHIMVRGFAMCASSAAAAFNFLMPKPLQPHQITAGSWGVVFALLHGLNFARLWYDRHAKVQLNNVEEYAVYEDGFHKYGMTPRQFQKLLSADSEFRSLQEGEVIATLDSSVSEVIYIVDGSVASKRQDFRIALEKKTFLGKVDPSRWRYSKLKTKEPEEMRRNSLRTLTIVDRGETWTSSLSAGQDGCRLLVWPLESFIKVLTSDDRLLDSMVRVALDSLTQKLEKSAYHTVEEAYAQMLRLAICDGVVVPQEKRALNEYRERFGISDSKHEEFLVKLGWTAKSWGDGMLEGTPLNTMTSVQKVLSSVNIIGIRE